jgi:hypothetical protein
VIDDLDEKIAARRPVASRGRRSPDRTADSRAVAPAGERSRSRRARAMGWAERWLFCRAASVAVSSSPTSRLKPTTSAGRMAATPAAVRFG